MGEMDINLTLLLITGRPDHGVGAEGSKAPQKLAQSRKKRDIFRRVRTYGGERERESNRERSTGEKIREREIRENGRGEREREMRGCGMS